ncbi:hypothetical protein HN873_068909, partial [Arachis hypogaea]
MLSRPNSGSSQIPKILLCVIHVINRCSISSSALSIRFTIQATACLVPGGSSPVRSSSSRLLRGPCPQHRPATRHQLRRCGGVISSRRQLHVHRCTGGGRREGEGSGRVVELGKIIINIGITASSSFGSSFSDQSVSRWVL